MTAPPRPLRDTITAHRIVRYAHSRQPQTSPLALLSLLPKLSKCVIGMHASPCTIQQTLPMRHNILCGKLRRAYYRINDTVDERRT